MKQETKLKLVPIPLDFWARLEQAVDSKDASVDSIRKVFASIRRYGVPEREKLFTFQQIATAYGIGATRLVAFIEAWDIMRPYELKSERGRIRNRVWALNADLVGRGLTNEYEYDPRKPIESVNRKFVYYETWDEKKKNGSVRVFTKWTRRGVEFLMGELSKHDYTPVAKIDGYDENDDSKPSDETSGETHKETTAEKLASVDVSAVADELIRGMTASTDECAECEEERVTDFPISDKMVKEDEPSTPEATVHGENFVTLADLLFDFLATRARVSLNALCSYLTNIKNDFEFDIAAIQAGELPDEYKGAFIINGKMASASSLSEFSRLRGVWVGKTPEALRNKIAKFRSLVDAEVL